MAKELGKLVPSSVLAANRAAEKLLRDYEQLFEPLFGKLRAGTE